MNEKDKAINTLIDDYSRLKECVFILHGVFMGIEELLIECTPHRYHRCISAYAGLLGRVLEETENSYAVCEKGA